MIGQSGEDYLKLIYKLGIEHGVVSQIMISEQLEVSPAAVTKMGKRLQELNLLSYTRSGGFCLTPEGEKIALEVIRHHRLIELYLMEALGYSWDEVHEEAEILEHVISEAFEEKIDAFLGYPTHDPHGDPIPSKNGEIDHIDYPTLDQLPLGERALVRRVGNHDADMLKFMGEIGLYPGTEVELLEREPYGGSIHLRIEGEERSIGRELAENVFVSIHHTEEKPS